MSGVARLDQHLVREGLARSRTLAQRLIRDGAVTVDGQVVQKMAYAVAQGQQVSVTEAADSTWVGRGALKLLHALSVWGADASPCRQDPGRPGQDAGRLGEDSARRAHRLRVTGRRCLDVGASTGGFTQVLLAHGAAHVTALDVGRGQLVPFLAADPRVTDLPGTNIREVSAEQVGTFEVIVGDVSFISLRLVLPCVAPLLAPAGDVVFLVKPQFEVGRDQLGRGGVVGEPRERGRALEQLIDAAADLGWAVHGLERSPVTGTYGNTEYLLWFAAHRPGMMSAGGITARIRDLTGEDD